MYLIYRVILNYCRGFRKDLRIILYVYVSYSKTADMKEILRTVPYTGITVQVTKLVQFRKFHRQHQCTLQLVRGHGVLLVYSIQCTEQ
jgi:hypothetical protein